MRCSCCRPRFWRAGAARFGFSTIPLAHLATRGGRPLRRPCISQRRSSRSTPASPVVVVLDLLGERSAPLRCRRSGGAAARAGKTARRCRTLRRRRTRTHSNRIRSSTCICGTTVRASASTSPPRSTRRCSGSSKSRRGYLCCSFSAADEYSAAFHAPISRRWPGVKCARSCPLLRGKRR